MFCQMKQKSDKEDLVEEGPLKDLLNEVHEWKQSQQEWEFICPDIISYYKNLQLPWPYVKTNLINCIFHWTVW